MLRFIGCAIKSTEGDGAGHASRSGDLFRLEACRARVFWSVLKTGVDATTGGARGTIVKVM
jgi:hypothetical protein